MLPSLTIPLVGFSDNLLTGLVACLILAIWPGRVESTEAFLRARPTACVVAGGAITVIALLLAVILSVTLILIPLALALAAALVVLSSFGWVSIYGLVGRSILASAGLPKGRWLEIIVGILAFALVGLVPLLGGVVALVGSSFAVGAALLTRLGGRGLSAVD